MKKKILIVAAVIVVIGVTAIGINKFVFADSQNSSQAAIATVNKDFQEVTTQLESRGYPALVVQENLPVKWTIIATEETLNSCNNEIVIPSLGITKKLQAGENVIEFTPTSSQAIEYSCWMGMINSNISVVEDLNNYDEATVKEQTAYSSGRAGSCCTRNQ